MPIAHIHLSCKREKVGAHTRVASGRPVMSGAFFQESRRRWPCALQRRQAPETVVYGYALGYFYLPVAVLRSHDLGQHRHRQAASNAQIHLKFMHPSCFIIL